MTEISYTDTSTWRQQTALGIPYRTLSHTGSMSFDKVNAQETYLVKHSDLEGFIRELFPLPVIKNGIPIYQYRAMPGNLLISASSVTWKSHVDGKPIDPFSADPTAPTNTYHPIVEVTVSYDDEASKPGENGQDVDENDPETFIEISCDAAGEFIHTPVPGATWVTSDTGSTEENTSPTVPCQIIVPEVEWSLTWPRVNPDFFRNTLIARLRAIMGKVNTSAYALVYDAPAESLLFTGWSMSEERQVIFNSERGKLEYRRNPLRLTMKMLEKRVPLTGGTYGGHNHIWRPGTGWQKIKFDGTNYIYQTYDYANLFLVTRDEVDA